MVTFKDSIDCTGPDAGCTTGFGAGDIIYILMKDPVTGDMLDSVSVTVSYVPGGQVATPLMSYEGTTQPPTLPEFRGRTPGSGAAPVQSGGDGTKSALAKRMDMPVVRAVAFDCDGVLCRCGILGRNPQPFWYG